jgi:hypothetical protein
MLKDSAAFFVIDPDCVSSCTTAPVDESVIVSVLPFQPSPYESRK